MYAQSRALCRERLETEMMMIWLTLDIIDWIMRLGNLQDVGISFSQVNKDTYINNTKIAEA